MSLFGINIEFENTIYTRKASGRIEWNNYFANIHEFGISLFIEFEFSEKEKTTLFKALSKDLNENLPKYEKASNQYYAHWHRIPASLQRKMIELDKDVHEGAKQLNQILRKNKKSARLPTYNFRKVPPNSKPNWNMINWILSENEKELFKDMIDSYLPMTKLKVSKHIQVPLPDAFRGRNIQFYQEDIDSLKLIAEKSDFEIEPPFTTLYSYAVQNYENRSFSSFVITLTASLETGLKWFLAKKGDNISKYLLDNIQSPPITKLLSVAINECKLQVPEIYKKWLGDLLKIRNQIVHKPGKIEYNTLELSRWLAIGESVLLAIQGMEPYQKSGFKITISERNKSLPKGTKAIIMREEDHYGESNLHITLESGISGRTIEDSLDIDTDQKI